MNNRVFYKNTIMLYVLKISNYLFSFITVPLQTRVLGANNYALLGFSLAIVTYFQNFIDFGFTLSGTEKISRNVDDHDKVNNIFSTIFYSRIFLFIFSTIVLFILYLFVSDIRLNFLLILLYYLSVVLLAFSPDFLYLGLQKMEHITYRTLISKLIFTVLLFFTLREENQILLVPIYLILGNLLSLIIVHLHIFYGLKYKLVYIPFKDVVDELKYTSQFFLSRFAMTLYTTINTISLGSTYGSNSLELGFYRPAEQLISTGKQVIGPVSDSLYPHMVRNKDFSLLKKIVLLGSTLIVIGSAIVFILSDYIAVLLFGENFITTGLYIKLLSPCVLFSFLTIMTGYPLLSPLGLTKYANLSNVIVAIFHIVCTIILLLLGKYSVFVLCILTCISEFLNFLIRLLVFFKYRNR